MTEAELLEYRNSYSGFLNSIKEIYKSMESNLAQHLEFCKFEPDIDDKTLIDIMNNFFATDIKDEEPLAIICIGSNFEFTATTLYILGCRAIKFDEIDSIFYKEETKTSLFGKTKIVPYLVVKKKSGEIQNVNNILAVQEIAEFFDAIVKAFKENPPEELPAKEYPRTKLIIDNLPDSISYTKVKPKLDVKKLNSLIIKSGKDELKESFAVSCDNRLFFSNDNLYYIVDDEWKKIPYKNLSKVVYSENECRTSDDSIVVVREIAIYDKDRNNIRKSLALPNGNSKEVADFFSMIISDATGTEIKTEVQKTKEKRTFKDIIQESFKKGSVLYDYILVDEHFSKIPEDAQVICEIEKGNLCASFCMDSVWIKKEEFNEFKYDSLSKATLERISDEDVDLVLYDVNEQKCVSWTQNNYFSKDTRIISKELADVINGIISVLTGKTVGTECIDVRPIVEGAAISDSKEEKDNWNNLINKWNNIFLNNAPIEYRKFTDSEKEKLPQWWSDDAKENYYYFIENAVLNTHCILTEDEKEEERKYLIDLYKNEEKANEDLEDRKNSYEFQYFPEPYAQPQKFIKFYEGMYSSHFRCVFNVTAGDITIDSETYSNCNREERASGFAHYNGQADLYDSESFFKFIDREDFVKNCNSFVKKLGNAKEEGLQAEKKAKQAAIEAAEKAKQDAQKAKEQSKQNLMNDLNNW